MLVIAGTISGNQREKISENLREKQMVQVLPLINAD